MNKPAAPTRSQRWTTVDTEAPAVPGYDEWMRGELRDGLRDLEEGRVIKAEDVWKDLGLE